VRLAWRTPAKSVYVVVVRYPGRYDARSTVLYRGRTNFYVDKTVKRPGKYRYLIRNYDRRGKASSGVTSVIVLKPS
jgi:hypothetical protein